MALKVWRNKGWYFKYKDQNIFYIDEGEGEVLVLIHGFPTSSWDWHKLWPSLTRRFHVITLDMLGFGFSDKPLDYKYSIHDQADLFEKVLLDLGVADVHIVAHDYGDTVAQELLARYLERKSNQRARLKLRSLCLLNGGLFPETHQSLRIQKLLIGPLGRFSSPFIGRSRLQKNFKAIFGKNTQPSESDIDEFWEMLTHKEGKKVIHRLIGYIDERIKFRERWLSALQKADIPIRLIFGEADPIAGKHMAERFKDLVANPDVVLLDEIGHYPQLEAPELVLKHYFQFVNPGDETSTNMLSITGKPNP